jgi:hypothetical protein
MTHRTPRELIEIYWERVYNAGEVELVREVCADPIIRHDPGVVTPLSHDEQIERVKRSVAMQPLFTHRVLHADDTFVTSVWNMVSRDGRDIRLCGIEVFEAHEGRFTRCWNSSYGKGFWGEDGDLFDPAALPPPPLIAAPGEITADWLQRAFANSGAVEAQRLAMEPEVTAIGHGTTSQVAHVRATYNSGHITAPRSAICKIGQWPAGAPSPFERERRAYALFGEAPAFRVPRLYYGASNDSGLCNLLIEDLSASARPGDQIAGCSIAEAEAVVRELARFHRAYLGRTDLFGLDWLTQHRRLLPAYAKGAGVLREWLGGSLTLDALGTIDSFGALAERWLDRTPAHPTLIHGDLRVDNVLFEDGRACLIDWQSLGHGDPQHDVAYFLSGSLSIEDRRASERDLIAEHAALITEADPGYTFDAALASYRGNVVSGLWMTVIAAAHVERNAHNARLLEVLVDRNTAAIRDWDGLAAIA